MSGPQTQYGFREQSGEIDWGDGDEDLSVDEDIYANGYINCYTTVPEQIEALRKQARRDELTLVSRTITFTDPAPVASPNAGKGATVSISEEDFTEAFQLTLADYLQDSNGADATEVRVFLSRLGIKIVTD
jgi:hypothetical protein